MGSGLKKQSKDQLLKKRKSLHKSQTLNNKQCKVKSIIHHHHNYNTHHNQTPLTTKVVVFPCSPPLPANTIASFVALEVGAMEAKMLHSAVSSKPMTKHRDGERSAVRTLDKTSVVRCFVFLLGEKKTRGKRRSSHWRRWLRWVGIFFCCCAVFFVGWTFFCWGLGFFGGVKERETQNLGIYEWHYRNNWAF